jgi:hypothetical protein
VTLSTYVDPHMREQMARTVLEVHVDTPQVKGWYLKIPGYGRTCSTLLLFTREGIVIMGDLCPGQNGVISCLGYGWEWFAGRLSENYLCEKFLRREFVLEKAIEDLRRAIIEGRRSGAITKEAARLALDRLAWEAEGIESIAEIYHDAGLEDISESIHYYYDSASAGWLCAIQQRFRELMAGVDDVSTEPAQQRGVA